MNSTAQLSAAQQLASSGSSAVPNLESSGAADDDEVPELEAVEEEGPVDETGVEPKDIELVMQQVNCSRAKAVKVLKESGGDLINASMLPYCYESTPFAKLISNSYGGERVVLSLASCVLLSATVSTRPQKHCSWVYLCTPETHVCVSIPFKFTRVSISSLIASD